MIVVLALGLAVAGCVTGNRGLQNAELPSADRPGTSIKLTNPNPQKWLAASVRDRARPNPTSVYVCKPLACAGAALVGIQTSRSPTRHPDRTALEKAAKLLPTQAKAQDLMMEAASEGDERLTSLSSKVTEVRGYPAILAETKRTSRGKASYILQGHLFIGLMQVKIISQSTTREEARRNFDEFAAMMEIFDVEAPLPGASPESQPPVALDTANGNLPQTSDAPTQ